MATVSRSFTVPDSVAPATRARVLAAAAELHYEPNRAARGLITGRTGNVGVIVPDLGNPYFHGVLGAQARARQADYAVFVADGQESATEEEALINAMRKQVDGIVLCSSRLPAAKLAALDNPPTVVLLNRRVPGRASVVLDRRDEAGGAAPGRTRASVVRVRVRAAPVLVEPAASAGTARRRQGAWHRVRDVGPVAPQFQSGVDNAEDVLKTGATAVLAYNDLVAVGILSRLADSGSQFPSR